MQGGTENGQEDDRCNKTLEREEILNLGGVSHVSRGLAAGGWDGLAATPYLGVRDTQEGNLKQEVEQKANHSSCGDTLTVWYFVGDVGKAWPDGSEQYGHALTASRGLNTVCS